MHKPKIKVNPASSSKHINFLIKSLPDHSIIEFETGTYMLESPIIINRSHIHLTGADDKTTLNLTNSKNNDEIIHIKNQKKKPLEDIAIGNLALSITNKLSKIQSIFSKKQCAIRIQNRTRHKLSAQKPIHIQHCTIENTGATGIITHNAEQVVIENVQFQKGQHALQICQTDNLTINTCSIKEQKRMACIIDASRNIHIADSNFTQNSAAVYTNASHNVNISNTAIKQNRKGVIYTQSSHGNITTCEMHQNGHAVVCNNTNNLTIEHNEITRNTHSITITDSQSATIVCNRVQNNEQLGINLTNTLECTVQHNELDNNGDNGIILSGSNKSTVENNTIMNSTITGILLKNYAINNKIKNNKLTGNATPITETDSFNNLFVDNES